MCSYWWRTHTIHFAPKFFNRYVRRLDCNFNSRNITNIQLKFFFTDNYYDIFTLMFFFFEKLFFIHPVGLYTSTRHTLVTLLHPMRHRTQHSCNTDAHAIQFHSISNSNMNKMNKNLKQEKARLGRKKCQQSPWISDTKDDIYIYI